MRRILSAVKYFFENTSLPESLADVERELLAVLSELRSDLPDDIYKEMYELVSHHGEYGVALEFLADWLSDQDIPITQDIYQQIETLAISMQLENSHRWQVLQAQIK
jgi:hypothetical protein